MSVRPSASTDQTWKCSFGHPDSPCIRQCVLQPVSNELSGTCLSYVSTHCSIGVAVPVAARRQTWNSSQAILFLEVLLRTGLKVSARRREGTPSIGNGCQWGVPTQPFRHLSGSPSASGPSGTLPERPTCLPRPLCPTATGELFRWVHAFLAPPPHRSSTAVAVKAFINTSHQVVQRRQARSSSRQRPVAVARATGAHARTLHNSPVLPKPLAPTI